MRHYVPLRAHPSTDPAAWTAGRALRDDSPSLQGRGVVGRFKDMERQQAQEIDFLAADGGIYDRH